MSDIRDTAIASGLEGKNQNRMSHIYNTPNQNRMSHICNTPNQNRMNHIHSTPNQNRMNHTRNISKQNLHIRNTANASGIDKTSRN